MGAYEVAENGDFANWRIPTRKGGGNRWSHGSSRLRQAGVSSHWSTPPKKAGPGCSSAAPCPSRRRASSSLVVDRPGPVRGDARGVQAAGTRSRLDSAEIQERTEARLVIADDLREFRFRARA